MDISQLTIGQAQQVAALFGALAKQPQQEATADNDVRIVILQRGWVVVGYYKRIGGRVLVTNASVIRRWGTTKGIGELRSGPTASTVLEPCGEVDSHELAEIAAIKCDAAKWSAVLK